MAITDNLSGYWDMDEAMTGDNAVDDSGNGLTLTDDIGSIVASSGTGPGSKNVRDLTIASSHTFSHADAASLGGGDIDMALNIWVNPDVAAANDYFVCKGAVSGPLYYEYLLRMTTDAAPDFAMAAGAALQARSVWGSGLSPGTWVMLTGWHDADGGSGSAGESGIAVNASVSPVMTDDTGTPTDGGRTDPFVVGGVSGGSFYYDGKMALLGMWNGRFPDGTERTTLYNGGSGLAYSDLTGGGTSIPIFMHHYRQMNNAKPEDVEHEFNLWRERRVQERAAARRDRVSFKKRDRWQLDPATKMYLPPATGIITPRYFIGRAA